MEQHELKKHQFAAVNVIHNSHLYCLVPNALFDKNELANYLKFNAKLLANDEIVYDVLPHQELICVYVPFTNINNYILDCFGEFEYTHNSAVLLQSLFQQKNNKLSCFVHVSKKTMEIVVLEQKTLLLYNQFDYATKEDFLYYVLFTYEQLDLDVESVKLKLFGSVEEDDPILPAFNTPEHKYNIGLSGRDMVVKLGDYRLTGLGFSVNYKWIPMTVPQGHPKATPLSRPA